MSGRKSRKSQKLGSSRRNVNRSNNRDTEEKESDDGNPQTGHEEHKSEQQIDSNTITENPSDDASLQHQPDQAKTSGISQQASPSELHIQSQESKDLLTQAEAVSKKRKMGSTRKSRGFKGGEIPEEEPEQNLGVCEEIKEEHEETKKQSVEVRKSKEHNDQHVLSDYSSCQPTKPESFSLQSAPTGISSHEHELLEGATFCAESTSHSTHLSVGKPTESTVPSHEKHLTLSQVHQQVETLPDFTGLKGRKQGSDDSPLCENSENTEGLSESISKVLHQHWTVDPEEQGIPLISSNAYDFLKDSQESQYAQIHSVINQSSINIMHQDIQEGEPMFSSLSSTAETKEEVASKSFGKEHEQEYSNSSEKTVYSTRDGSEEKWQNATQTKTENDITDNWLENKKETLPEDLECINDELQSSEYMKGNEDHKDEHLVEDRNECAEKVEVKHPVQPAEPNENSTLSTIEENLEDRPFDKSLVVVCDSSSSEMQHDCSVDAVDENTEKTEESLKGHDSEEDNKTKAELLDFVTEEKITSSETMCEEVAEEINMIKQEYNLTQNSSEEISLELEMQRKEESESKQESRFYDEKSILLCDKERGCDLAENENQHYFEEIRLSKNRDNVENVVESDETLKLTMTNANVPESTDIQRTEKITLSAYDRQEGVSEDRVHAAEALTTDHITGPAEIISLSLSEQPQTEAACNEEDIRYKYKEEEEGVVQLVSTLAKEDGAVKDYSGRTGQKKYRTVSPTYSGECEEYNIPHLSEEQFKAVEVTTEPVTNSTIDLTEDECKTSSCFTQEKWLGSCDTLTERREQGLEDGIENDVAIKCKNISQEDDETLTTVFVCAENEGKVQDCSAKPECDVFDSEVMTNTPVMISNVLVHQTECVIHNEETKAKVLVEKEKHEKTALDDEKSNDSIASNDQKIPQIKNDAGTFIDSSQEMSIVVEEYDKENVSQVHTSLTSGTMKDIPETQDNVDIPGNAENIQEMAHDQTAQLPWHYNRSEDHLEKSESQSRQEDNVISETPELSTSGKRRKIGSTRFSHRGQLHGGDKKKINEKEENQDDKHLTEEGMQPKEETNTCPKEDSSTEDLTAVCSEHVLSEVSSLTAKLSLPTNILPSPVTEPGDSKTDDGNDHENVEMKITEQHPQSQSKKKKRFGSTRKPQGGHRPDNEEEERQLKHTETAEEIEHDVEERCSLESSHHEVPTDLLTESTDETREYGKTDMSNATLTDTDIQPVVNEASKTEGLVKIIEVHEKSVLEEEMVDDFESTDEQKMPHITTDMKNNTYTPHDVSQEISEVVEQLHEENSESGSPDQVHAPLASGPMEVFPKTIDNEGEGRQMKDTEAAEEIKHDVEVRCSPEISHREVSTDLLTESTDETGEYGKTDMSHATFTDTDVQPFVNDASKTEGLVEMIEVHGKSVLEDETVDDFESTDEQKMPHITTDMQNNTHTHHDVSQEMSEVVEELDEDNNENGSPRQVHAPLTSDPREIIPKTIDNEREERKRRDTEDAEEIEHDVEEKCSDKTPLHKVTTELLTESQSDVSELPLSMLGPALEKEITKSTDETGEIEGIDRSSDASTDIDVHAVDHEVNKAEGLVEVIGVHGKLVEENMEPKEDQTIRSAEDSTTEQHLISELSSKTAELSLPTYIQPSPVTELSDSKTDDGNDHENVEMKITELHPQSQSKKKKRFGSTRKPQGGHRPDNEGEERQLKDTEAAEEIEHDVEERCSEETTRQEVTTDLLTESQSDVSELPLSMLGPALEIEIAKSTDETGEIEGIDRSSDASTDIDVHAVDHEVNKAEGLVEVIGVHGKLVEENMEPKEDQTICSAEDPTTEHVLSELSSETAELSLTSNTQLSILTELSESKSDDGNDLENVEMKITELHPQSQSKKKKRFGSTRKPQGGHRPDHEGEERKLKHTETAEEIEHDVEEICSAETSHHEVPTDLLTESTDETEEYRSSNMLNATVTDTDVQPIVCEASKTEGLVEMINVHEKPVLEDETVDDSDEQKMPHITTDMQNETSTLHDVSQEISEVVEEHNEDNNESGSPNQVHFPLKSGPVEIIHKTIDNKREERKRRDTEAADEIEHDVEERCSEETTRHEVPTDLLTESQSDVSGLPLSMLGPALEKEITKSTDETGEIEGIDRSSDASTDIDVHAVDHEVNKAEGLVEVIGVHGKLVEESMEPKEDQTIRSAEDPTTEQHVLSELSSETAELSLTSNTQLSILTELSESKSDDGNDLENVEMKITEFHPQSQSKKKKRFGSTRKPQGGHRPDNEEEERKLKHTETAEEIEHDVEERYSEENTHHELITDLPDMSNATLTDTDVQPIVCEASKTEGLVEIINVHEKTVLEGGETVDGSDEQKMPHINIDMQNETSTPRDVSQEISEVVEELDEDNNESGSPNQVHSPLTSVTVEVIPKTIDNEGEERQLRDTEAAEEIEHDVEERCSEETTHHEVTTDLLTESQSDVSGLPLSMLGPALEIEIAKSTDNTGECEGIDRSSDASTDIDVHAVGHGVNKAEGLVEVIGVHGKLVEESMEPKEDQTICSAEDFTTEDLTAVCSEQHLLSELSSQTAELSLTTNTQLSTVTEPSQSKTDDGNDHENVEIKITELHPQSQSKKKKRFGSTRKPQGGHRPDNEGEEKQLKDAEAAEEIEHDLEEICSPETFHHEVPTDLLTESTDETGEHGKTDMSHATLTDTDVQPIVNEASKTEGLVEIIEVPEKTVLEEEIVDDSESTDEQKMTLITTDMQNNTYTHHDVSQEISEVVEELDEENNKNGSPNQVHAPLTSGTVEIIAEKCDTIDIPVNTENRREAISDLTGQIPQDHSISEDNLEKTTHKESENTTTLIHIQESVTIQDNVITETPELSTSGKRRTRRSHREQLYGGDKEKMNEKEENRTDTHNETSKTDDKLTEEETIEPKDPHVCPTEEPTTENVSAVCSEPHILSEVSSLTADLSLTTNIQPSPVTKPSDSKTDDGNDYENVEMKITELHPQSQSKKKKRFGSTRKPQGGHRPDNEEEERKLKHTETAEEIGHDVEERYSEETTHHELITDLPDMSNATLTDTDVQPIVCEASKTEGLVEMIEVPEKTVLEEEIVDDSESTDEQKMTLITTDMQNNTYTLHDVSQDISVVVEGLDEDNNENGSPNQFHDLLTSGTMEFIAETHDSIDIPVNTENRREGISDLTGQIPQDHSISEDNLEKTTHKESENTTTLIHIQVSVPIQDNVITETPELSTSGKRRKIGSTRRSHREQFHGGNKKKINEKEENEADTHDEISKTSDKLTEEETIEPKEDQNVCPTDEPTTENVTAVCSEQHILSEVSSLTADLSLTTNKQPSPVTEHSDSKTDDGNDHGNVEMKITELHPQSQSKKKKRFGSTRKPQGGQRPNNEGEERQLKHTETAEEIRHDVEERYSEETTHHELITDLPDMSNATLTDTDVQPIVCEASKTEGLVEIIHVHEKPVLEDETVDGSDEQKIPHINIDMQNETSTHHDVSQEISVVVKERNEENNESGSPNQVHAPLTSGTVEFIHKTIDNEEEERKRRDTEAAEEIEHDVEERCSEETTHHEITTDLLTESQSDVSELPLSMLGPALEKEIAKSTDETGEIEGIDRSSDASTDINVHAVDHEVNKAEGLVEVIGVHGKLVEESMEQKEDQTIRPSKDFTTEQHLLSELSSQTAKLSLTTNTQLSTVTEPSQSKTDDGNDYENVEIKITELHPQSQSKKKKRFGSTRKPQGGHRPDHEEEERKLKDAEAAEEIEHDVEERYSEETTHHELITDLPTELTDETGETDMSHATLTDTDVQSVVCEASKTEGLVEIIEVPEKTVLEEEIVDDSEPTDEQKMTLITTDMKNNTYTLHDVSQEISEVVEELDEDNNESGSPSQVHAPLTSGTVEVIPKTIDNEGEERQLRDTEAAEEIEHDVEERCSEETTHREVTTDLLTESQSDVSELPLSVLGPALEKHVHGKLVEESMEKKEDQTIFPAEDPTTEQHVLSELSSQTADLSLTTNIQPSPVTKPSDSKTDDGNDHENVEMKITELHPQSQSKKKKRFGSTRKPQERHRPDNEGEERQMKDKEAAEELEHEVEGRCSDETPLHEVTTDLLTESCSDGSGLPLSMLSPALEIEIAKSTDNTGQCEGIDRSSDASTDIDVHAVGHGVNKAEGLVEVIGVHGKLVEESMEPKEDQTICSAADSTTEQHLISELSSETAELSLPTNIQPSPVTELSDSKTDDGDNHENVEMKTTELHPQSQNKKKKRFGSTRKPQGGHRPDHEGEERKKKDTEAVEEIENDVEERFSPETTHHEVPTDLLTESTDETGEHGTTDMSHATLTDTDVQPFVCEASKTEGLVEIIEVPEKTVLEEESVDDSESTDEQKMPLITTDMQNNTYTHHDVSQEIYVVVEELDEENNENRSPSQVHAPLTSGTVEFIAEKDDTIDIPVNTENRREAISDLTGQIPQDHSISEDNLEKTTHKESENTTTLIHTQESVTIQDNVITETPELSTSGKRRKIGSTRRSHRGQLHGGNKKKINEKEENQADIHDEISKTDDKLTEEETIEPKEDQNVCPTGDLTTEDVSAVCSEQHILSEVSSLTADLSLTTNKQPSPVTKPSDSKTDDGNDHENVEMKITELHPQSQNKKKKRVGSTRKPQGGHRPDNEEEERQLKHTETAEEIRHDVEERYSEETTHHELITDLPDMSNATLTDTDIQPIVCEASKTEGLVEIINVHEKTVLEDEKVDGSDEQKMPHINIDMQNETSTHHDVSQEISEVVEELDEYNNESGSPNQVHSPLTSGPVEIIPKTIDKEEEERKRRDTEAAEEIEHDVEERCSDETTHHEVTTDLLTESQSDVSELPLSMLGPALEKEMAKSTDEIGVHGELVEESMVPKEDKTICSAEDPTTEQHVLSELSSQTAELSLTTNTQLSTVTKPSESKPDDGNDHENVDMKITELHPQSQSKKKKRFGSTRKPQGGHRPDNEGEERQLKDTEAVEEIEHDVEEICSSETFHHEVPTDLLIESTDETGEHGTTDMSHATLTDTDVQPIVCEASKTEGLVEMIEVHEKSVLEDETVNDFESTDEQKMPHITTDMQNNTSTHHDVSQDISEVVEELYEDNNESGSPNQVHVPLTSGTMDVIPKTIDNEREERKGRDTEAAEEIEHDVEERCSDETTRHEVPTDLLNETQSDVSGLPLSMLGPALEKEIAKSTDNTGQCEGIDRSSDASTDIDVHAVDHGVNKAEGLVEVIGVYGKLVEESMEPKEDQTICSAADSTTEQHLISELSSKTAELSLTTNIQPSPVTELSDSKTDDGNDHENVEMKITELHPQSQSKKKKRFGSTRKPQGGHRPDHEEEERQLKDAEAAEEIEHDVEKRCSPETSHHEVPTNLLTESTDETGEHGTTDKSNATLTDTDVQPVVNEASKTEGLVEMIRIHEKSLLEDEKFDNFESTDKQKMPHISTDMQNNTHTHHDVSQEISEVVDEDNRENGSPNQVHAPLTSGTEEFITETHDSVDIPVNTENSPEAISDLTGQIPQDHSTSEDNLEKTTHKESENTTTLIHTQESVPIQDNVITETPELSTSGKRRTRRSHREQLYGGDKEKINISEINKEKRYIEKNDLYLIERSCISGTNAAEKLTEEETMEPEEEISNCPTEDPTTKDFTALGSEQHLLSELSFQTADLSLTTNIQPSPVTETSDSKTDGNDHENVEIKITELHPQSQNKKKKRFGSTRRPQGGHRPDNEGEKRKWKDTEAAGEIEHDVEERCSPEISHHESTADLLTKSQSDLSGSLSVINPSPEKEIADSTNKTGECERFHMPFVALTDTVVHTVDHDVSKEDRLLENSEGHGKPVLEIKKVDETESSEVNTETHDRVGIPVNAENIHAITPDQIKQFLHHDISEVHPEEPTDREPESTSLGIHIQEIKTTEGSAIAHNPELSTSGKRRKIGSTRRSHREQLHGGGRKTINEKEENICEKDKNRNFEDTKNVNEEQSMEAKEEESTIHTEDPTTDDFPAVCSEHVLSESSSQTAELSLSTNIQPSPLTEHPDDGNDHENVELKITELHPQSQSKKKKRFGSTRKPQGGHRPDNEGEERKWKDTEAAEETENDVEERCSKETTHYEISTDLLIESQSDMSEPSLSMLDPPLEKVTAESSDETGECGGVDLPAEKPVQITDVHHKLVLEVEKVDDSKSSEINVQIQDSIELEKPTNIIQSHTSTDSLIHTQESNTIQDNVIPESSELSTSGKKRKIGSTRRSHREQLHGRDKKKINEEEENQGAKDEEERYGEESAFNLADRSIKSGTQIVIEEESMPAKEEIGASQTEDPTTENVCSEQHVLSELSSQTAELSLTTNIQPSPVSESKTDEDGNDHENVKMKITELHPQSQSKKKKRFGSTRKPQGGHRPDNEGEERQLKDTEAAEETEHGVEERCSQETTHYDISTDLMIESQSDLSGFSLCMIDPSLEKETQLQNAATDLHLQDFKNVQCIVISEKGSNPKEQHLRDDQKEATEELKEEGTTKELELEESTAVTQEASLEAETLRNLNCTSNAETAHPSIATELSVPADSVNLVIPEAEKMDKKRRKMGSTRRSYKGADRKEVLGETGGKDPRADEDMEDTLLHDTASGWGITANTTGQDTEPQIHHMFDKSEGSLLNEIEFELNMSCQLSHTAPAILESSVNNTLSPYNSSENSQPAAEQCRSSSELQHSQNSQIQAEISSPARRRKMGSTRKTPRNKQTEDMKDESLETEHQAENLDKIELEREKAKDMLTVKMTEDKKESVELTPKVHDSSASTELPPPGSKRKFGSRRTAKGSRNLGGLPPDEFEPNQEKTEDAQVLSDELTVCDPYFTSGPQSTPVCQPVEDDNMEASSLGKEHVNNSAVNEADVSTGLVSLDDLRKSALYNGSTGKREKIDFERWSEQIPDFGVAVYNVVMVGNSSVGKTSFMNRLQSGNFSPDYCSTIGVDTCVQNITLGGRTVKLHVWDTAGQERYHSITRQVFHKAQGLLLMYDITSSESFCAVRNWVTQIKECAPDDVIMILLGNKNDCAERKVQLQEGEDLSREYKIHFLECSAATGENVEESMKTLACLLVKQNVRREEDQTILQPKPPKQKSGCC